MAIYYRNGSQLFFLRVSKFRETLPDTVVILGENWSPHGSQSQELTKSDLMEKFYFEACVKDRQATWVLGEKKQKKKVPTVEAFCEVMSIPNLVEREQSLRGLLNHEDRLLAKQRRRSVEENPTGSEKRSKSGRCENRKSEDREKGFSNV